MGLSPLNISQEDNATDAGDVCAFVVKVQQSDEIVFAGDHSRRGGQAVFCGVHSHLFGEDQGYFGAAVHVVAGQ